MNKHRLNGKNYFSDKNELKYCGSSQLKSFVACEAKALAKLHGQYEEEKTKALLVGSYIDSYYEGTLEEFKEENKEYICTKASIKKHEKGVGELELLSDYTKADEIIERLKKDELFSKYMNGEKQKIFVGDIDGVPFKIKVDSYHPDKAIVDLKVIANFDSVWNNETKQRENFVIYWKYHWQAAIYQEIVRQNTGKQLPFFICVATKEPITDYAVLNIPQDVLDEALNEIKGYLPRIKMLKEDSLLEGNRCEHCDYCKATKKLNKIIDFRDL